MQSLGLGPQIPKTETSRFASEAGARGRGELSFTALSVLSDGYSSCCVKLNLDGLSQIQKHIDEYKFL